MTPVVGIRMSNAGHPLKKTSRSLLKETHDFRGQFLLLEEPTGNRERHMFGWLLNCITSILKWNLKCYALFFKWMGRRWKKNMTNLHEGLKNYKRENLRKKEADKEAARTERQGNKTIDKEERQQEPNITKAD